MKAPDAFRTISEAAEELELPQHVLRFWETRFNEIRPMKRGGGRRYYRPEDVDLLRGVRILLYAEGFTIRGVQRLLKENGAPFVAAIGQTGSIRPGAGTMREPEPEGPAAGAVQAVVDFDQDVFAFSPEQDELERSGSAEQIASEGNAGAPLPQAVHGTPSTLTLTPEAYMRIQTALADLEEAKRLLDQVR